MQQPQALDPDSKRIRWQQLQRRHCNPKDARWGLIGFLLGLLVFATFGRLYEAGTDYRDRRYLAAQYDHEATEVAQVLVEGGNGGVSTEEENALMLQEPQLSDSAPETEHFNPEENDVQSEAQPQEEVLPVGGQESEKQDGEEEVTFEAILLDPPGAEQSEAKPGGDEPPEQPQGDQPEKLPEQGDDEELEAAQATEEGVQAVEEQVEEQQGAEQAQEVQEPVGATQQVEEKQGAEQSDEKQEIEHAEEQAAEIEGAEQAEESQEADSGAGHAEEHKAEEEPGSAEAAPQMEGHGSAPLEPVEEPDHPRGEAGRAILSSLEDHGIKWKQIEDDALATRGLQFFPPDEARTPPGPRKVLVVLGADRGTEVHSFVESQRAKNLEYDHVVVWEPRKEMEEHWAQEAEGWRQPTLEAHMAAAWTADVILGLGDAGPGASVLYTRLNNLNDPDRTSHVRATDFGAWLENNLLDEDTVTILTDLQGAEIPVFAALAASGVASKIDTLYMECHFWEHAQLIQGITVDLCRDLCLALTPQIPHFWFWVGPDRSRAGKLVRGEKFISQPGTENDCSALHS